MNPNSQFESVLLQAGVPAVDAEVRTISQAVMLSDGLRTLRCTIEALPNHQEVIAGGRCLPVGSVEFMRAAMALAGIEEPPSVPYPQALRPWLRRHVRQGTVAEVNGRCFVKPAQLKRFDGFVLDTESPPADGDQHARGQYAVFQSLWPTEKLWISDPVEFLSEWRYYVAGGKILGLGRYDPDGEEDAPAPDPDEVRAAIAAWGRSEPYALDMGVLADGRTALVEVNEAWAIGLYEKALAPKAYLAYLAAGWEQLMAERTAQEPVSAFQVQQLPEQIAADKP